MAFVVDVIESPVVPMAENISLVIEEVEFSDDVHVSVWPCLMSDKRVAQCS